MQYEANTLGDLFRAIKSEGNSGAEVVFIAYEWLVENHSGQGSWEYEALSRLQRSVNAR